jgi:hypothetical protein
MGNENLWAVLNERGITALSSDVVCFLLVTVGRCSFEAAAVTDPTSGSTALECSPPSQWRQVIRPYNVGNRPVRAGSVAAIEHA